jgi:hypothetical protein
MRFRLIGALIGLAVLLVGMGVAYGLPASKVLASDNHKSDKSDSDSSKESKEVKDGRGEDASKPSESHGAAVSVAAHCLLKGAAHGALVRSTAKDEAATPVAAVTACKAAGGKETNGPGNSDWAHKKSHGKSDESHGKASDAA